MTTTTTDDFGNAISDLDRGPRFYLDIMFAGPHRVLWMEASSVDDAMRTFHEVRADLPHPAYASMLDAHDRKPAGGTRRLVSTLIAQGNADYWSDFHQPAGDGHPARYDNDGNPVHWLTGTPNDPNPATRTSRR